ncbi:hypothetical protein CFC21_109003 [Triticum aestivum]|uniref:Uncharacterized protein n=2 Tax=Triticum aestivum TaxID=4565 RepID=A0A3B6TQU2_WHEAT|nr:uncharacterized protein LOC123165656 [Triticum aestivum]KAF7108554.1 hypothetical protein CFC21_109003 [Triticum aestivum]
MDSGGNRSGTAGGGDGACSGGHLCHLCGYKYASAHPSAKQRRAHRKNCGVGGGGGGKSPPTAAAASAEVEEERQGKKLVLGEDVGGEGNGAPASDSGGVLPGSAEDVGNAVDDDDTGVHSSPNTAGVHVIINDVTSEGPPKANGTDVQTEVDLRLPESAPHFQDLYPSESHCSGDQHQDAESHCSGDQHQDASASHCQPEPEDGARFSPDFSADETSKSNASASHCQPEPEDGARFSPDFSADETSKSNAVSLASDAASGEFSAQTIATAGSPDGIAVTENDCMINTIEEDKTSEGKSVKGNEIDSSYQEKLQSKIVEGHSPTAVEEDLYVNDLGVVPGEQNPSEDTESKDESGVIEPNPVEQVCTIKEPVDVLGNKEPSTDNNVHTDDTSSDDLSQLASGGCHLEAADVVETQQQIDSTSVVAYQLTNSKQTCLEEGSSYPGADEVLQAVSSVTESPVDSLVEEVISAGSASDVTKKDTSEVTTEDDTQNNSSHTSNVISMPSQIDPIEPSLDPTQEISMSSKHDVDENKQIENVSVDLTSRETNDVCSTDNIEETKQIEEISAEESTLKTSILQSASSVEEKEQIEEVIADPASDNMDVISSRDIIVQKEQSAVHVGTVHEINVVDIPAIVELEKHGEESTADLPAIVELEKHGEETTADPTAQKANITDEVEEKKQDEEITPDPAPHAINVTHEDNMQNEDKPEIPSSHENVLDDTDIVKEKGEETMSEPTSHNTDAVSIVDAIQGKEKEEVTPESTLDVSLVHTIDNVKGKESEEPTSGPTSVNAGGNAGTILVADSSSHMNSTPQGTNDAKEEDRDEKAAADHARTDGVEEKKQKEETAAETNTKDSANDHLNEEITDKEMTIDSDKSHVSLKSLLSEKGIEFEVKEKKASTKDRMLSFRRRSSKDNPSPTKPGSEQQDWNSPARLPVEKSPKGKKQQWMPFICCHSMN